MISSGFRLDGGYCRIGRSLCASNSDCLIFFRGACDRLSVSLDVMLSASGSGSTRIDGSERRKIGRRSVRGLKVGWRGPQSSHVFGSPWIAITRDFCLSLRGPFTMALERIRVDMEASTPLLSGPQTCVVSSSGWSHYFVFEHWECREHHMQHSPIACLEQC
jgi:hypothetical protein